MTQDTGYATGVFTPRPALPPPASGGQRTAARLLQAGALAAALAAATFPSFDLDRFSVPKEAALHLTALSAGMLALTGARRFRFGVLDGLLALVLVLGAASAALAQNPWAAGRAVALSASGAAVYWSARSLSRAGLGPELLAGVVAGVVVAAATALAQAYGLRLEVFSTVRAPGGTLGNRNFVAHACALGLPVAVLVALRARRWTGLLPALISVAVLAGTLVLTRSRAAWLGAAAALVVLGVGGLLSGTFRRDRRSAGRLALLVLLAAVGATGAVLLPNRLRWRSENPYAQTAADLVNYQEGSGRGRLIQYRTSLRMALTHPLLGVGPGNWPVTYPRFAGARDPSLDRREAGMTANPWPSSDWAAYAAERGLPATAAILVFFLGLAARALARARTADSPREATAAVALGATVAATLMVGMFDAVLLLPLPTLLVATSLGALSGELGGGESRPLSGGARVGLALLLLAACGLAAVRSAGQLAAMALYERGGRSALEQAARLDPGNYRVRLRLARAYTGRRACERRRAHAEAAAALFPTARAPRPLRRCG